MRSNNSNDSRPVPFYGICFNCNLYGHRIAFCPEPKKNFNSNSGRQNNSSSNNNQNSNYQRHNNNHSNNRSNTKANQMNATNNDANEEMSFDFTQHMMTKSSEVVMEVGLFDEVLFKQRVKESEINSLAVNQKVKLLQAEISLKLVNTDAFVRVERCLLDGGSTHSWLNTSLFENMKLMMVAKEVVTKEFLIEGAITSTVAKCKVVTIDFKIGSWCGEHEFIISNKVNKYDAVLGRDFFLKYNVVVNHGDDSVKIGENKIELNSMVSAPMDKIDKVADDVSRLSNLVEQLIKLNMNNNNKSVVVENNSLILNKNEAETNSEPVVAKSTSTNEVD